MWHKELELDHIVGWSKKWVPCTKRLKDSGSTESLKNMDQISGYLVPVLGLDDTFLQTYLQHGILFIWAYIVIHPDLLRCNRT